MMLLKEIKIVFHTELDRHYGAQEVASFFYLLIDYFLGLEKFVLALQPELVIGKESEALLFNAITQLKQDIPIQYIIGETGFMDLIFKVSPSVLIPRPETEDLVRWIVADNQGKPSQYLSILDIGTGSGCISISLAKGLEGCKMKAMDISSDALELAKANAVSNGVKIDFLQHDILKGEPELEASVSFDIIVSNPPYVRELEKKEMQANVLNHEPKIALFIPDEDPLLFYKAIASFAAQHLVKNGSLYLEINQYLGAETVALLQSYPFKAVELRKDIFGNDRMIKAVRSI
ncbi:peptide chain release factor N(5)-glutamine methyltransferase [Maribacter antarcticus]|uniref:peptide chain release factor N(5)-glutamine methyltransferase n=1 Tax=Maribacter antarcticus TaxID=505250 RepID=UPI000A98C821|nr:peptide chain release factor N(5)-glutamine methyltransferase [Maribacter antarcticus]